MNTDFRERIIRKQKTAKKFVVNRDNNQFKKKLYLLTIQNELRKLIIVEK